MITKNTDGLLDALKTAQEKQDYESVAKYYLQLGKEYRKKGMTAKALYYLNRFDNLVGGMDSLYDKFAKKDDQVCEWIEELEEEHTPYEKTIQEQVLEKAEDLSTPQKLQWLLLTMSRFCRLFTYTSLFPEFEVFGELEKIVSYFTNGFYGELEESAKEDIEEEILDFDDGTDEVFDSILMSDYTKKVEIPEQESFVPADLEGGDGTFFFGAAVYVLSHFIFDEVDEDDIKMEFAACGLMTDYYYRTSDTDVADEPKIKEETGRIFSDYEFVKSNPDAASFRNRIAAYKKIMLV